MHRIDTSTAQQDKFGEGKNGFTDGAPQSGDPPTKLDSSFFDSIQEEISGVIESEGVALDVTDNGQLNAAIDNKIANATGAIPAAPVTSVNGKTGDVILTAADFVALPIPTTFDQIGVYGFMSNADSTVPITAMPGMTFAGDTLRWVGTRVIFSNPVPSGTWMCCGALTNVDDKTLFVRIA